MSQNGTAPAPIATFSMYGRTVEFYRGARGVVLDSQKRSESRVYSTGGGGTLYNGQGYVSAPQVRSVNTLHQHIWIQEESGTEHCVELRNVDVPLRPGQIVTTLTVSKPKLGHVYNAALVNHSSQSYTELISADLINQWLGLLREPGCALALLALVGWLGCVGGIGLSLMAVFVFYASNESIDPSIWLGVPVSFVLGVGSYTLSLPYKIARKKVAKFTAGLSVRMHALAQEMTNGPAPRTSVPTQGLPGR